MESNPFFEADDEPAPQAEPSPFEGTFNAEDVFGQMPSQPSQPAEQKPAEPAATENVDFFEAAFDGKNASGKTEEKQKIAPNPTASMLEEEGDDEAYSDDSSSESESDDDDDESEDDDDTEQQKKKKKNKKNKKRKFKCSRLFSLSFYQEYYQVETDDVRFLFILFYFILFYFILFF